MRVLETRRESLREKTFVFDEMFRGSFPFTQRRRKVTLVEGSCKRRTIMMRKIFALALLSVSLAACEPSSTDNNSSANKASSGSPVAATPAPTSPTPEAVATVNPQLKAGDKVRVTINGSAADATVVSVDEKAGKVTVKIQGQKEDKTVAIGDVVKQ
jgi:hypothetical protein